MLPGLIMVGLVYIFLRTFLFPFSDGLTIKYSFITWKKKNKPPFHNGSSQSQYSAS